MCDSEDQFSDSTKLFKGPGDSPMSNVQSNIFFINTENSAPPPVESHPVGNGRSNVRDVQSPKYIPAETYSDDEEINEVRFGRSRSLGLRSETLLCSSDRNEGTGNFETFMHLLKGNVGSGALALPIALKHAGLWTGLFGILFIGFIATHCMHMLVNSSHILGRRTMSESLDYSDCMEVCLRTGPKILKKLARPGRIFVDALLIFTQLGFCAVYIVFIASNIEDVISHFYPNGPSTVVLEVIVTIFLIPYIFIKQLKHLAPFSMFSNLLIFTGLFIIFQYILRDLPDVSKRPTFSDFNQFPLFCGTAFYSIEGISLVLPLENNMKRPKDFSGYNGILNLGMVSIVSLFGAIGFYGYLKFGDEIQGSITLNLPSNDWLYLSVKIMYSLGVFITYNLMFYVPINILWPLIKCRLKNRRLKIYGEYPFRVFLLLTTLALAAAVPHLDLLIALIGAFASISLAIILPVTIEMLTLYSEPKPIPVWIWVKNTFIMAIGMFGFFTGTYSALREIVQNF